MCLMFCFVIALRRCTLGEISDALRAVWGDHTPVTSVVQGAYSTQYSSADDASVFEEVCNVTVSGFVASSCIVLFGARMRLLDGLQCKPCTLLSLSGVAKKSLAFRP
jgi:hypothetical protein